MAKETSLKLRKLNRKPIIKNVKKDDKNSHTDLDSLRYALTWNTVNYDKLPNYMKDNEFIYTSYRPLMKSKWLAFSTVFRFHNETINIWY